MANEMRLVDAAALEALFDERYDHAFMQSHTRPNIAHWEGYSIGVNWGRNTIADAPTVDARPVVHGEWLDGYCIRGGIKEYESIDCSNCGDYFKIESHDREYWKNRFKGCPFCGAEMDGGDGE